MLSRVLGPWRKARIGFVMCAIGERHLAEAIVAARSVKHHMDVAIDITTNREGADVLASQACRLFDTIKVLNTYRGHEIIVETNRFVKIQCIAKSRFAKTIYIDTDVIVLTSITEMFDALDIFDVLACHAPVRTFAPEGDYLSEDLRRRAQVATSSVKLKHLFSDLNCGVMGFSDTRKTRRLLACWERRYVDQYLYFKKNPNETPYYADQGSFRLALLETRPNLYIMPSEYNVRTVFPYFVGGNSAARVLHGRGGSLQAALSSINKNMAVRVGLPATEIVD